MLSNNFVHLNEFEVKLLKNFPETKSIHYIEFINSLCEVLSWDFHVDMHKDCIHSYVKYLYRRYSDDEFLDTFIPVKPIAINMISDTKRLIIANKHYISINNVFGDAVIYLKNNSINDCNAFTATIGYPGTPIFPPKKDGEKEPAFVGICSGRGNGKSQSQLKMLDKLIRGSVYGGIDLKYCNPLRLGELGEDTRKKVASAILYGDGRNISSEDTANTAFELVSKKHQLYGYDFQQIFTDDVLRYCKNDIECMKEALNSVYGVKEKIKMNKMNKTPYRFQIKKVIFNNPATVVYWENGDKTVVKCQNGEAFDPEKGLAMAISKRALGDCHEYYETFKKHVGKYYKQEMKKSSEKITNMILNCAPYEEVEKAVAESKEIIDKKPKKEKK